MSQMGQRSIGYDDGAHPQQSNTLVHVGYTEAQWIQQHHVHDQQLGMNAKYSYGMNLLEPQGPVTSTTHWPALSNQQLPFSEYAMPQQSYGYFEYNQQDREQQYIQPEQSLQQQQYISPREGDQYQAFPQQQQYSHSQVPEQRRGHPQPQYTASTELLNQPAQQAPMPYPLGRELRVIDTYEPWQPMVSNRFQCDQCDQTVSRKHDMPRHVQCVHLDERKFSCNFPGCSRVGERGFNRRDKMQEHTRTAHWVNSSGSRRRKK